MRGSGIFNRRFGCGSHARARENLDVGFACRIRVFQKANTETVFTCEQGQEMFDIVEKAIQTGEAQTIQMISTGVQVTGEIVSITKITWSFKAKK